MKYIAYLILLSCYLSAAQLILDRYEEEGQSVDIYHLVDKNKISCHEEISKGFRKRIVCELAKRIQSDLSQREDTYFTIYFSENKVIFEAKAFSRLLPTDSKLIVKDTIISPENYRHWTIVGSKKRPDIFTKRKNKKFNFPVQFKHDVPPFIGALDLNGEPTKHNKGAIYLAKIKKLYKEKNYTQLLRLIQDFRARNSGVFSAEMGLYELRALSELAKSDSDNYRLLLGNAKEWLEEFPSNAHVPEIYMYIVESYLGRGRLKQGEKYLGLLKSGFGQNPYTQRSELVYGDTIYKSKKRRNEALRIYKKILFETKDLETAAMAAVRLAKTYLDFKEPEKADKIIEKVLRGNPGFIKEHPVSSYELAKEFAKQEHEETALKIIALIDAKRDQDFAEELLKSKAFWLEKSGKREEAIAAYNSYLKKYKESKYTDFVKKHLDALMISREDENITQKLAFLDEILKKYNDKNLVRKALAEKAKILYKEQKYHQILKMQEDLSRYKLTEWLKKSAKALAIKSLKEKKCEFAIDLLSEYNMTIGQKYDEDLFWCYLKSGMFDKAKKIIDQNIDSRDLSKKLKWLYLALKYYKSQDDNKKVILVANDILKLEKSLNETKYDDVLYDIADAYYNLRNYDDLMLETVKKIEKEFPDDLRNIDLFMKVVHYGQKKKEDLLIVNYAKKVIDLEKKYKVQAYSPQIEILYAHELQKIGKYRRALNVVLDLLTHKLTDAQKAEVLYLAGELSLKLGQKDAATEFYTKCGEIVKDSAWQKLCAENLEILSE